MSLSVHSPKTPARTDGATARQPTTAKEDFDAPTKLTERENTPPPTSNVIDVDRFIDSLNIQFTAEHGVMLTPEKQSLDSSRVSSATVAADDSSDVWEPTLAVDSTPTGPDNNFVVDYDDDVTSPIDTNMKSLSDGEDNVTSHYVNEDVTSSINENEMSLTDTNVTSRIDDDDGSIDTSLADDDNMTSILGNENVTSLTSHDEDMTSSTGRSNENVTSPTGDKESGVPRKRLHRALADLPFL